MVQDYGKRSAHICLAMQAVGQAGHSLYVLTAISMGKSLWCLQGRQLKLKHLLDAALVEVRSQVVEGLRRQVQLQVLGVVGGADKGDVVRRLDLEEPRHGVDRGRHQDREDEGGGVDPELDTEERTAKHDVPVG